MYIVAIAWTYVTLMMALTERSLVAGVMTFVFYGALPLALFLWLWGTPARRRRRAKLLAQEEVQSPDRANAATDEQHLLQSGGQLGTLVQTGNEVCDRDIDHAGRRET